MIAIIDEKRAALEALCLHYHVRRLELFGSATGHGFDPQASDLDFLVEFQELEPAQYADSYFGLLESLQNLFQRPIDLVTILAVKNPYFLQDIEATRTVLYAA